MKTKHRFSFTTVKDNVDFEVELEIDLQEIAQRLAARAIRSKGLKATTLRGDIVCKVISSIK
jgi:hypothetical protein